MGIRDLLIIAGALLGTRGRVIISFIGGLVIGLVVLGWWIWPVQWKDAAPADLEASYRQVYLDTVARISAADPSVDVRRLLGGDSWSEEQLTRDLTAAYQAAPDAAGRDRLVELGRKLEVDVPGEVAEEDRNPLTGVLAVFLIVLIGVSGAFFLMRIRQRGAAERVAIGGDPDKVAAARTQWAEDEAPLAEFTTSYALGDDLYDLSFSIETATGAFLGECGVGILETIGVGDPKKVTAFDVWLFDKSLVLTETEVGPTTETKVLMTEHCYHDQGLRDKLASKGEAVLAEEGTVIHLTTSSLHVQAKVIEMEYGDQGFEPENSYVTRLTVELAAWQLEGGVL